ncbi:MAG: Ribosomal large subunit pseudouridine synthase D [Chlamydiales bacterium]|nr:Ribosomal large subunit pseudouridine synthase D [Chlamydiales bacterium]
MNTWKVRNDTRLLSEVKTKFPDNYTTKDLRWAIEHNRCYVNGQIERFCSTRVQKGDVISIHVELSPKFVVDPARILYEDCDLLVYNKPIYFTSEALAELLQCHLVHRLDRDTSGVMLFAKTQKTQLAIEDLFAKKEIKKEYLALVEGTPGKEGVISGQMKILRRRKGAVIWGMADRGLSSQTNWKMLKQYKTYALLLCQPLTGRTHQIRVHLQHIKHPILGDPVYGSKGYWKNVFRPLLHAHTITFCGKSFTAPIPEDFSNLTRL